MFDINQLMFFFFDHPYQSSSNKVSFQSFNQLKSDSLLDCIFEKYVQIAEYCPENITILKVRILTVLFLLGSSRNREDTDYPWASQCHSACHTSKDALQVKETKSFIPTLLNQQIVKCIIFLKLLPFLLCRTGLIETKQGSELPVREKYVIVFTSLVHHL